VWACGSAQSPFRCTKCNSHPSAASVPITVLLYDGPLLCGFNVAIKGLTSALAVHRKALAMVSKAQALALRVEPWSSDFDLDYITGRLWSAIWSSREAERIDKRNARRFVRTRSLAIANRSRAAAHTK